MADPDSGRKNIRRQERQARNAGARLRQPPRSRDRRHRHRQDGDAADDGRRLFPRRRAGVRRRHQGRPVRHRGARRSQGSLRQARQGHRLRIRDRRIPGRVLGPVRRAGPSDPRHRVRDWARCCCRASSISTTCRKAFSTSCSAMPTTSSARPMRRTRASSTSRTCARCCPTSPRGRSQGDRLALRQRGGGDGGRGAAPAPGPGEPGRHRSSSASRRSTSTTS